MARKAAGDESAPIASEIFMTDITAAGASKLGDRTVNRMGYGAMQLAIWAAEGPSSRARRAAGGRGERGQSH
jgi:hypothetical protein